MFKKTCLTKEKCKNIGLCLMDLIQNFQNLNCRCEYSFRYFVGVDNEFCNALVVI